MVDSSVILAGGIPAAVLARIADASLTWLEKRLSPGRRGLSRTTAIAIGAAAVISVTVLASGFAFARPDAIVIGSKNFTEQVLLGELLAQTLERRGIPVTRRL